MDSTAVIIPVGSSSDSVTEFVYPPYPCQGYDSELKSSCVKRNPGRKVAWKYSTSKWNYLCDECYHLLSYSCQMKFVWCGPPDKDPKYKFVCQPGGVVDVYHHANPCTCGPEIAKILDDMEIGLQAIVKFREMYCRERGSELTREIGWSCMDDPKIAICRLQDKIIRGRARSMRVSVGGGRGFRLKREKGDRDSETDDQQSNKKKAKINPDNSECVDVSTTTTTIE